MITPEEVQRILEEIAGQSVIREDSVSILGRDSLDLLSAYESIERWSKVVFPDKVLVEFQTVGDVIDFVMEYSAKHNLPA